MKKNNLELSGSALVEGVMIKNEGQYAMALRKGNSDIEIVHDVYKGIMGRGNFRKIPILRGIFALIDNMVLGIKTFLYSSDFYEDNTKEEPRGIQKFLKKFTGKYHDGFEMVLCITLALVLSIGGFIVLPHYVTSYLADLCIPSTGKMMVMEAVLRIVMIILYIVIFCLKKDFRRMCAYHGAQHKVMNCLEKGEELTISNVNRASKYDDKCEVNFLFYVFFISVVSFAFLRSEDIWFRMALRVAIIPIVAAILYEIMLVVNNLGKVGGILHAPGRIIQRFFVGEPSADMLEVAIESLQAVFDWREYMGLPPIEEDVEDYSQYDYADNVSMNAHMYDEANRMQESMYSNHYYDKGDSYNNESYNYSVNSYISQSGYDNIGYEDYEGQYFVESHGNDNPHYKDIANETTKQPMNNDYNNTNYDNMYDTYMQNSNYANNYDNGYTNYDNNYTDYDNMQYGNMYNQGNYYVDGDDDLKGLDRYFTDDNY